MLHILFIFGGKKDIKRAGCHRLRDKLGMHDHAWLRSPSARTQIVNVDTLITNLVVNGITFSDENSF